MGEQLTDNAAALRMFFTDDIYLVGTEPLNVPVQTVPATDSAPAQATPEVAAMPAVASPVPVTAKTEFKYLGKNQKNVLIIVNDQQNEVSSDRGKELLRNIVKAIQLSANDFALVNYSAYEGAQFTEMTTFFSSKLVMIFGVQPSLLGLSDQPKNMIFMEAATQVVYADNLDLLAEDQVGKKTLWGSIKKLSI